MSSEHSDRDEDALSGVEQPIDDSGLTKDSQIVDPNDIALSGFARSSGANSARKSSARAGGASVGVHTSMGSNEEDLGLAVEGMDELELLCDQVASFEQLAFETKKRVNAMDRLAYKSQLLPPTLRLCYQALQKSWMQDEKHGSKMDFDSDSLDQLIAESIKTSGNCIKEFGKFKGEFYALNEPILNKDISQLSPKFVAAQVNKQQGQVDKLSFIEDHVSENDGQIEELKDKFETFQREKFEEKLNKIEAEGTEVKEMVTETDSQEQNASQILKDLKGKLKEATPLTRDQRSKHSEVLSKLQKAERKYQKWKAAFDSHSSRQAELHDQIAACQKIVESLEELSIKTMVAQSKKIQNLVDCSLAIGKYRGKLLALSEESGQILEDAQSLEEQCGNFLETLQEDIAAEYDDLIGKIRQYSQNLEDDISGISESLNQFESKVGEMKISDQDHFFLNKEILRNRTALNSMDSQRSLFIEDTEAIEDKFSMPGTLDDKNPVRQEDLDKLRDNLKHLQKQEEVDLPKIKKQVDGLEQYVMRSLKNQLNGDNKLSQTNISKVKKNYEEFLKQFERLNHTYNDCVQKVNNFNGKFDSDDLERMNQLKELQERLKEEETGITGSKTTKPEEELPEQEEDESEDGPKGSRQSEVSEDCLLHTKRAIIEAINGLVNQFNDITKVLRDSSGKSLKAEGPLNDLIAKNKQIQMDCIQTHETIDGAKQAATDIQERLLEVINGDVLEELLQRYRAKETLIEDCQKVRVKAEKQQTKLAQQLTKQVELVEEQIKKLDMFNPINGAGGTSSSQKQEFLDEISDKIDKTNELMDNLQKLKEDNEQISENIAAACLPLGEVGEREVLSAELEGILETLNAVSTDLAVAEADVGPKSAATAALQKDVKALIGQEVEGRLKEGQNTLDVVDQDLGGCHDTHGGTRKKLKHFREQVEKVSKNQGQRDPQLLETLDEMLLDANQLEDIIGELDTKLNDQKRKKTEARRQMDDMLRGMQGQQKFKPSQLDGVLATLDELKDKNGWIAEKLASAEGKMESKLKELDDLVASCETKQELQQSIGEAETQIDEDLTNLRELLDRLPTFVRQLQGTVAEMSASAGPADDFSERKEELAEQLEELEEIEVVVDKFEETFGSLKDERDKMKKQKGKASDTHQLQKLLELMQEARDQLSGLFTDALDTQEQLEDLKKDVGDCDIPMLLSKRKGELSQFTTKGERLKKELSNLKRAKQKGQGSSSSADDKIAQMVKEVEFKLKIFDKDRQDLVKTQAKELDTIQALEYDDVGKASELLKRIRKFKNQVLEADQKLKDLEEVHTDIVKKLTEQDLENSTDLLALKAQELRERLKESRLQLQRIQSSGEAMDGNTSTNEEEEFIQALQNEMPEVLDNIETNLGLLVEIEKLVPDVKQSMSLEKMNDLREKVEIATENVEESEGLVIKLEKEILEWNAQKKLCKRDCELEEARNLLNDYLDDLRQEKQNTEIELQRNREKQEQNRDQEMVDKDGKKVDIMKDLIKLEEEMEGYVKEIDQLSEELATRDTTHGTLQEGFDAAIPHAIIEERQRRTEQSKSSKLPDKQLKRPPMLKKKTTTIRDTKAQNADGDHDDGLDTHQMLKTNCTFRNPIKDLLKDLKSFNQRRKELEDKYAQMRREVFKLKQIKLYKPVQGDAVDEMFAGYLNKAKLTIEVQRISASNYMFGTKKILAKIINGRLVIRVGGGYMNAEEFIEQYGKIEMMKIMKMKEDEVVAGYEGEGAEENTRGTTAKKGLNNTNTTPNRRGTVQANKMINVLGDAMKQKMREQLQFVKAYDTQTTQSQRARQTLGGDSMRSLGSSQRQRGALNNTMNKQQTSAEEKARHRETIGNLAKELSNIQSNYRTTQLGDGGVQSARKGGPAQSTLAATSSLSARGGSKSPNSGVPSASDKEKTPAKPSSRIGAGSRKSNALSNTFGGKHK